MSTQEQIPYKLYTTSVNGMPTATVLPGTNTPYGYKEVDYAGLGNTGLKLLDYYKGQIDLFTQRYGANSSSPGADTVGAIKKYNDLGGDTLYQQLQSGQYDPDTMARLFNLDANIIRQMSTGATVGSGNVASYIHPLTGEHLSNVSLKTIEQLEAQKAGIANGTLRDLGNGMTVPVGSAADLQLQGKSYEEQLATPSVQQQIKDQNLQPVAPTANQPQQQMGFAESLNQVYLKRPDLQALYNADGSAKNPNDPRVAGIPTLMDWAKKFGVNEESTLKQSFAEFQQQQAVLNPSPTNDPAQKYLEDQINQGLQNNNNPAVNDLVDNANALGNKEAAAVSAAQQAAELKDFMGLDKLMTELETIRKDRQSLTQQILQAMQKSDEEKAQEKALQDLRMSTQLGQLVIEGQPIPMPFIVGQSRELEKMAQIQISNTIANLERLTGERLDKVETLKFMYDASSNDFSDAVEMYKMSAPENIYTDVDSQGNLVTVMQNPLTGEIMRRNLGKVGDNKEWQANKDLSLQNPGNNPFFSVDGRTIINRQSGRAYESMEQFLADGGKADASNVDWMSGDQAIIKNQVLGLMDKYWDAGILPSDSYQVAMDKAKRSKIYIQQVTNSSGGGGTATERLMADRGAFLSSAASAMTRGSDTYVNPDVYRQKLNEYRSKFGESVGFLEEFPLETHISPENRVGDLKVIRS